MRVFRTAGHLYRFGSAAALLDRRPTVDAHVLLGGPSSTIERSGATRSRCCAARANTFAGNHVALANVEYRWPITRPQRGYGTWPLFLHTIHAAVFADAGQAWTRAFERSAIKSSAGAQLSADLVAGFFAPFTVSVGAAWGHDGSASDSDRVTAYFRVGKAF
jgi:hypothetical protein